MSGTPSPMARVEQEVGARTGLVFPPARRAAVDAAIRRRCGDDAARFLARMEADPQVLEALLTELTVGETYFFREPAQLEFVRDVIAPGLLRRGGPLRMWSAGCATGEEAYSLAMLAHQAGLAERVEILATDLSRERIVRARGGRYGAWSVRGGYTSVLEAHARAEGKEIVLSDTLRRAVEFRVLNLARDDFPRDRDVILCRNVLIYLDPETVDRVAQRLIDALSDDGWLLLGASDPPLAHRIRCRVELTPGGVAYRPDRGTPVVATAAVSRDALPPRRARPETRRAEAPRHTPTAPRAPRTEAPASEGRETWGNEEPDTRRVRELAHRGRLAEAAAACTEALKADAGRAVMWYLRSVVLDQQGMHREAADDARRALYLDQTLVVAHVALGLALQHLGDAAGAARALGAAAQLLAAMPADAVVEASMGEPAGPLLGLVRVSIRALESR